MNKPRGRHGLLKLDQKIFAFGSLTTYGFLESAEVYDIKQN